MDHMNMTGQTGWAGSQQAAQPPAHFGKPEEAQATPALVRFANHLGLLHEIVNRIEASQERAHPVRQIEASREPASPVDGLVDAIGLGLNRLQSRLLTIAERAEELS